MIILNAVYFKGEWTLPFEKELTKILPFYNFGINETNVETKTQIEHFNYYEDRRVQAIELRFRKDYLSALIILPVEGTNINKYINTLSISNDEYQNIINGLKQTKVHLKLPKFEVEFPDILNQVLMDLGMYNAFNSKDADFTGLRSEGGIFISRVICYT